MVDPCVGTWLSYEVIQMVVRLFQRPYDFQRQPIRKRYMSDVEALTGILHAVLQSGGIHGRNFGEFTNYSVDEYPISMLQEMWSWGFPIAVTKTTPNSTPVRTYVPMEGLADIVADVEGFLRQTALGVLFIKRWNTRRICRLR